MKWTGGACCALAALILGLTILGCGEPEDENPASRFVTVEDLAGTWLREPDWGTQRIEFGSNMTFYETVSDELGTDSWEGTFEITETGELQKTLTGSELVDGVNESWSIVERSTPAVIGDLYHPAVLIRTAGVEGGLEGTWSYVEGDREEVTIGDAEPEIEEHRLETSVTITGDQISIRFEETQVVEGENYFDLERFEGLIRVDGELIYVTYTEVDSSPIPEEEQVEEFFGWLLDENTIDFETAESGDPADLAFTRQ